MQASISELGTSATPDRSRTQRIRTVAYWFFTLLVAYEMMAGALWAALQLEYPLANLTHLGYPHYLLKIFGVCDAFGVVALLVPRFGRLKEWVYARRLLQLLGGSHFPPVRRRWPRQIRFRARVRHLHACVVGAGSNGSPQHARQPGYG